MREPEPKDHDIATTITEGLPEADLGRLRRETGRFHTPILSRSLFQIATSFGGFFATCAAMYWLAGISLWLPLALAPLAAGFLVRIFIIQHDCGHGSFFVSRRANEWLGMACSVLTMTPFASWRRQHAGHHGVWNDLDRRESGADIYSFCLTVEEYRQLGVWGRFWYRATRHPVVANVVLPPLIFMVLYRLPFDMPKTWRRERMQVHLTSLAILGLLTGLALLIGLWPVLVVQLPVMMLAAIYGVWLFSVQHRGEQTRWARNKDWDPAVAALHGSSYLGLPAVLQWFTGNIGFHHVHHMNPRVPNYRLQECHDRLAGMHAAPRMSLWQGMKALRFTLWDEAGNRMVRAGDVRLLAASPATA
ncbi:MAG: fatty acid desaturase [Bauldia litoralis]